MKLIRIWMAVLAIALFAASCTASGGAAAGSDRLDAAGDSDEVLVQGTTTTNEPCSTEPKPLEITEVPDADAGGLIRLSRLVYDCSETVVVYSPGTLANSRFAAEHALRVAGPMLVVRNASDVGPVAGEVGRLQAAEVITIGLTGALDMRLKDELRTNLGLATTAIATPTTTPATSTTSAAPVDEAEATGQEQSEIEGSKPGEGTETTVPVTTVTTGASSVPETSEPAASTDSATADADASATSAPVTTLPPTTLPPTTLPPFVPLAAAGPATGLTILYPETEQEAAYLLAPLVVAGGGTTLATSFEDIDLLRESISGQRDILIAGEVTPTIEWQVGLAASDNELFGGGTRVFPDRRIIAYYGNPLTFRLGLLGETDPERAVERVTERAALYDAEGLPPALPGFEIIATVAATQAGDDGNYSNEMDLEDLRPWIETAMANDVSVILDLQPGRTDFLTQAKIYEEFLRLPNVGLALDPEWRLGPDQRHLRQIGGVSAEEVNAVTDYLAGLVREENLPQKILILHQFQVRMLPDRELIKTIPEIATVIHVDGQGSLGSKYGTWAAMRDAPTDPNQTLWWAWKNFIDEDIPTARPGQVNAVQPLPVIVTYQ